MALVDLRTPQSQSQVFFANVFSKGTSTIQLNRAELTSTAKWDNLNLRCLVLDIRSGLTKTGDMVTNVRVLVLPFKDGEFSKTPSKRARFDENDGTLQLVVYPPWGNLNDKGKTWESLLPTRSEEWQYYNVRPFDVLFLSFFQRTIATTHIGQLVDLVDVKAVKFRRDDGTEGVNVRTAHTSFSTKRFKPHEMMGALTQLPPSVLRLSPVDQMSTENGGIVIHFQTQLRESPSDEALRSAGVFAKVVPSSDHHDFVLMKENSSEPPKIYAKLNSNVVQWGERGFDDEPNRQHVMLQFTIWDQFCFQWGITDPVHWGELGPYVMRAGWVGVFSIDQSSSRSMPCNRTEDEDEPEGQTAAPRAGGQDGDGGDDDDDEDGLGLQLGGEDPTKLYDFGLVLRPQLVAFPVEQFYALFAIPIDLATLKELGKRISMVPNDENAINKGTSGNGNVYCISESRNQDHSEWIKKYKGGKGTFRVITNCAISMHQMREIPHMDPKQGGEFLRKLKPRSEEKQPRYYLFFVYNKTKERSYLDECAKSIETCSRFMRIKACKDRLLRLETHQNQEQPVVASPVREPEPEPETALVRAARPSTSAAAARPSTSAAAMVATAAAPEERTTGKRRPAASESSEPTSKRKKSKSGEKKKKSSSSSSRSSKRRSAFDDEDDSEATQDPDLD